MKRAGALIGVVITLGITYFVYRAEFASGPGHAAATPQQIDTIGVTSDLLSIGQAERLYLASHGSYGALYQLQADGGITFSGTNRRGYTFSAEVDGGQHFQITATPVQITATPADPSKAGWPTFSIDETMTVKKVTG